MEILYFIWYKKYVEHKGISITEDFTVTERQIIKELAIKIKENIYSNWKTQALYGELKELQKNELVLKRFRKVKVQ